MYPKLIDAKHTINYKIWFKFDDGTEGEIDLEKQLYGKIFEPLKNITYFKSFKIHPELNVISWDNGADFAPEYIYETIKRAA